MAKVTCLGFFEASGSTYSRKSDGLQFIRATRKSPRAGQTHTYLLRVSPSGARSYWSGLYPVSSSEGLYRAEKDGIHYHVLFEPRGLHIALLEASPGALLDAPTNSAVNINAELVPSSVTPKPVNQ